MTVPLSFLFVLSWDDSSSVSSGISDTLDTDDLNTSSSLSSYVNTPSVPHRDVDEQVSHWYQSLMVYRIRNICRSSHEKQLQNIIQFSFVEIIFTKFTLKWFYYLIIVLAHWVKMLATGAQTQTIKPGPNSFYDGWKFRRQCVSMIDKTKREVVFIF